MIAAWMLYCVAIAVLFVVVGEALERALHLARRGTRWAWVAALAGSFVVPAAAWLRPAAFGALRVPLARAVATGPITSQPVGSVMPAPPRSFSLGDLDAALTWAWGLSTSAVALTLLGAGLRVAAWRRRWRVTTLDGRTVLVSENVGPAVVGVWRPQVVLPAWSLELGSGERRLMLLHEDEHVRAHDPWLRAAGAALLVLAPWNPALWWQVRRLRLAVEMDCDARVLARGGDTPEYAELLLRVGQRRARLPLGAPALGEPVSFLGRRIRRMATDLPRWRCAGAVAGSVVAAAGIFAACEAPRPVGPEREGVAGFVAQPVMIARGATAQAESLLTEAMQGVANHYPALLRERVGPRVEVWFVADADNQVIRTLQRPGPDVTRVGIPEIHAAFPELDASNVKGWSVHQAPEFNGLLRDNVRVIWIELREGTAIPRKAGTEQGRGVSLPLDSAHAVAFALQNLCGSPSTLRDTTCFVRGYQYLGREHVMLLDRRPPAGDDRVEIRVSGVAGSVLLRMRTTWTPTQRGAQSISGTADLDRPVVVSAPPLQYPNLLRQAGIHGRVLVRAIIDTTGRAEPASVHVIESPHPGFDQAARNFVLRARVLPRRVHGHAVRAEMTLPINFSIRE